MPNVIIFFFSCIFGLLGAIFHVQHHQRHLYQIRTRMVPWRYSFHCDDLVGLRKFLCQPFDLYDIQPRIPESVQEDFTDLIAKISCCMMTYVCDNTIT